MERQGKRSTSSRLVRLTAIVLFAALLFGTVGRSVSAMKVTINNPGNVIDLTPVTGVVVDPAPTQVPTDVAVLDPTPTSPSETVVVDPAPTQTTEAGAAIDAVPANVSVDQSSASGYNFVYFDLFRCPKGYANTGTIDPNQELADCSARATNVSMHLIDGGGDHAQTASSSASWSNVVTGPVTIKQDIFYGQRAPFVFCRGAGGVFVPQAIDNGAMTVSIVDNQEIYCAWFVNLKILPTDGSSAPIANSVLSQGDNAPADPGSFYINGGSACPVGFDSAASDIYGLAANCHDAAPLTNYHVSSDQGTQDVLQSSTASFASVSAGVQTARVDQVEGFGAPRVFCKAKNGDAELEVQVTNNSWPVAIESNQSAYCDVISIPAQANGVVAAGNASEGAGVIVTNCMPAIATPVSDSSS